MSQFKITSLGKFEQIVNREYGKAFLHDELNLTSCEVSLSVLPQGAKLPFLHKHKQNEEVYIFLKGKGKCIVDNEEISLTEGVAVKIEANAKRTIENTGENNLEYICIQAKTNSLVQFGMADAEIL